MAKQSIGHGRNVAVVGAGLAGLTSARLLADAGFNVRVFDKGRGLGGRLATRRTDNGHAFDHGAQYVTARTDAFQAFLNSAAESGVCHPWVPRLKADEPGPIHDLFVGTPTMNALVKPIAQGLDVTLKTEVSEISRLNEAWRIEFADKMPAHQTDIVVCTTPAPQARALMPTETELTTKLRGVAFAPCWALMVVFDGSFDPGADAIRFEEGPISWVARNSSKAKRPKGPDCWVVHASPQWSRENLELNQDAAARRLMEHLGGIARRPLPDIAYVAAHRWRYAMTTKPLGAPFLTNNEKTLFLGGDWCIGARVEAAFESGLAIANAVIAHHSR